MTGDLLYVNAIHHGTRHDRNRLQYPRRSHGFGVDKCLETGPIHPRQKTEFLRQVVEFLKSGAFEELVTFFRQNQEVAAFCNRHINDIFSKMYNKYSVETGGESSDVRRAYLLKKAMEKIESFLPDIFRDCGGSYIRPEDQAIVDTVGLENLADRYVLFYPDLKMVKGDILKFVNKRLGLGLTDIQLPKSPSTTKLVNNNHGLGVLISFMDLTKLAGNQIYDTGDYPTIVYQLKVLSLNGHQ